MHSDAKPCGTIRTLLGAACVQPRHHFPTSLGSTIVTRFLAPTDALTPTGSFVATSRGSLIHVTRTSDHSISNHPRFSTNRVPLPLRWQLYFVRASSLARGLARTADRIEFTLTALHGSRCYGLVVRFPLLSTRGYRPVAVTFSYWPYSVGQVGDSHPAVPVRSQAHEHRALLRRSDALGRPCEAMLHAPSLCCARATFRRLRVRPSAAGSRASRSTAAPRRGRLAATPTDKPAPGLLSTFVSPNMPG